MKPSSRQFVPRAGSGRRLVPAIALGALLFLAACGDTGYHYSDDVIATFKAACTSAQGASENECQCAIESLQKEFQYSRFQDEETSLSGGAELSSAFRLAVEDCREGF